MYFVDRRLMGPYSGVSVRSCTTQILTFHVMFCMGLAKMHIKQNKQNKMCITVYPGPTSKMPHRFIFKLDLNVLSMTDHLDNQQYGERFGRRRSCRAVES